MNTFISVIIPLYNKENKIKNTIYSVLSQNYKNFEIIVIDDGSTDKSLRIVKEINDNRIKIFTKKNGGVSDARNLGIINSSYDWIAFLDADDYWNENYLSEANRMINLYTNADLIGISYFINDEIISIPYLDEGYLQNYFQKSLNYYLFNSSSVILKKNILKEIGGFNINLKSGEDIETWYRLVKSGAVLAYLPKPLSTYRKEEQVESKRIKSISIEKDWSYYIDINNSSSIDEKKYLRKILGSTCVQLVKNQSFKNLFNLVHKQGFIQSIISIIQILYNKFSK